MRKTDRCCVACGRKGISRYHGEWYCNMHWLRMYNNGTLEPKKRARTTTIEAHGSTAVITTSRGQRILIDGADSEKAMRYSWCVTKTGYAVANVAGHVMGLHRYLLDIPRLSHTVVDHKNGDTLDNRRANIRVCAQADNARNGKQRESKTGHTGIRMTRAGKYNARIMFQRKEIHIGNYDTLERAIEARHQAEVLYFGEYAPCKCRDMRGTFTSARPD